jgi:hypothetical protein
MSLQWTRNLEHLIWGPILERDYSGSATDFDSVSFHAVLCDLSPRFIPKCRVGRGYRAVSRNGRVLLASNVPMESLMGCEVDIRLQLWRKIILPGDTPEVYGVLMCARGPEAGRPGLAQEITNMPLQSQLMRNYPGPFELAVDVGGGMMLVFLPSTAQV